MIDRLRQALERTRSAFLGRSLDRDFDAELSAHLDFAIEENLRQGMSPENARRQALIRLGGREQSKELHREIRGWATVDVARQDLRYTMRTLRRDPSFAAIAVLILALGIGANVAVFSVVNGILLRPLPFRSPQQLAWITQANGKTGLSSLTYSVDAYEEFRDRNRSFQDITGYFPFSTPENERLEGHGDPIPVTSISVLGNFFPLLGVKPQLGRLFTKAECQTNSSRAVLLSYPFWQRQFAGDPTVVGRTIDLSGHPVTVAGVMPKTFDFGAVFSPGTNVDLFRPVIPDEMRLWGNVLALIGRLKPGVALARAQAEATILGPDLYFNVKYPESKGGYSLQLVPLKEYVSGKLRRSLVVLWCAVGLILLIVCVNLSNLLLARLGARSKEFAMRAALGAGRTRLVSQLLTETLVLSGAGAFVGLGLAYAAILYLAHQTSLALPLLNSVQLDRSALVWTILIAVCAAVLFGLVPGLRLSSANLQSSLKDMGHGMSAGRKHQFLRGTLVVSEVALACVLIAGSGLLLHSFLRVLDVDLGFQPARASTVQVNYDDDGNAGKRTAFLHEIIQRIDALPGVQTAGITDSLPLSTNRSWGLDAKGRQARKGESPPAAFLSVVTPGYMQALGIRLLKGRHFDWHDRPESQPVVIINETAARSLWPGQDPVERTAAINGKDVRVIGVAADVRESSLETKAGSQMYMPASQVGPVGAMLVVRSSLPVDILAPQIMHTLRSLNPSQVVTELRPIQTSVDRSVSPRRFFVMLVTAFAALGLVLAALGIYGVISYSVAQQTQEIGIRMALGATATRVRANILSRSLTLAAIGIAIGTIASVGVARLIASLLFETSPTDPLAFFAALILLIFTALLAGFVPAQRASKVDPMIALRTI